MRRSKKCRHSALLPSLAVILLFYCCGCSTTATFYPIQGPYSEIVPLPVIAAKADGILGNTGNISLTLPDGETCTGKWSSIAPVSAQYTSVSTTGSMGSGLKSAWSTVYGVGYSFGNIPGLNRGEAFLVGSRGTNIQAEFYTGSGTANGTGVAKDNKGNIFKVLF